MRIRSIIVPPKETYFNLIRPIVLYIFNFECLICGNVSKSNHVHHLNKNHSDNHATNLIVLCPSCHLIVHSTVTNEPLNLPEDIVQKQNLLADYLEILE